ncbi:hypothetical protein HMI55_002848 [Coelomomyces lativittatus]|nr:hypothetical protein HMI55_002848 [Coelomomyces lativittatus]
MSNGIHSTKKKYLNNILEHIGNTPLVKLNALPKEEGFGDYEIFAKCEFFNAGGSVKDRIAKRMVEEAEKSGILKPGVHTIIEPTSGNTGIGLALAAAVKGYKCIITLPEKMSQEKVNVLKALGADIIRTPTEAAWDAPESHIGVAKKLQRELPNAVILDQYGNTDNPSAHYLGTGIEIADALDNRIDMLVCGAGTGGTLSGTAKKLKELCPNIHIVGVDPHGSILAQPKELNNMVADGTPYQVEGIGYDFIPNVLDRTLVDTWVKTSDKESFLMARKLIRKEGLLCGGSCGSAVVGAFKAIRKANLKKGSRIVIILPDSVRNYMSKFLSDSWMESHGYLSPSSPFDHPHTYLKDLDLPQAVTCFENTLCKDAIQLMKRHGFDQLPVINEEESPVGMITLGHIFSKIASGSIELDTHVKEVMFQMANVPQLSPSTSLADLPKFFEHHACSIVVENKRVVSVVTKIDLMNWLLKNSQLE